MENLTTPLAPAPLGPTSRPRQGLSAGLLTGALCAVLMLATTPVNAQIRLGVRIIPQLSSLQNSQDSDQPNFSPQSTAGFGVGASIGYQFSERLGFNLDVLFFQQGQAYQRRLPTLQASDLFDNLGVTSLTPGSLYDEQIFLNGVKLPLLLTWSSKNNPNAIFRGYLGPQLSIIGGGTVRRTFANDPETNDDNIDYGPFEDRALDVAFSRFAGLEVGIVGGAGYDFRITETLYLNTSLRIEYGLTDIDNKAAAWVPDNFTPSLDGTVTNVKFYDHYYGPNLARTQPTRQLVVGFVLGVTYHLNSNKDPGRYNW